MALNFIQTPLDGVYEIEPQVFLDDRGFFMESHSKKDFLNQGIDIEFVQDNHSKSKKGVFRGFHFQTINTQTKLVRVAVGSVLDFAIDLRKDSPTYGKSYYTELSAQNKKQLLVPKGFAHGFLTLEDNTEFLYKCDDYYNPSADGGILYSDESLGIEWTILLKRYKINELIMSDKDKKHPTVDEFSRSNPF